jgi:hypothetical protein
MYDTNYSTRLYGIFSTGKYNTEHVEIKDYKSHSMYPPGLLTNKIENTMEPYSRTKSRIKDRYIKNPKFLKYAKKYATKLKNLGYKVKNFVRP